eukprot:CAMPEP_0182566966 /NCGR_PEP_ID=MMETSP1324-20130603/8300_1 /TAXON_ID=236786 /ORGANISM="Florenciella sp., Strain RCC1587" /LENGTH=44 /DNA_ID= /DNA_START= /DNA_END= /DNA_ORIENTATION=
MAAAAAVAEPVDGTAGGGRVGVGDEQRGGGSASWRGATAAPPSP